MKISNYSASERNRTSGDQPRVTTSLRERQKAERYRQILDSAEFLFQSREFSQTTIAEIADHAGVSTPTVFNYFKTKDQLLLALVLRVHHKTQESVRAYRPAASCSLADAVCGFLCLYTETSLEFVSRRTWRHVESTYIRLPDSEFVQEYAAVSREMLEDFHEFLIEMLASHDRKETLGRRSIAEILFSHWSTLFINLIRDDSVSLEDHNDKLRADIATLFSLEPVSK